MMMMTMTRMMVIVTGPSFYYLSHLEASLSDGQPCMNCSAYKEGSETSTKVQLPIVTQILISKD